MTYKKAIFSYAYHKCMEISEKITNTSSLVKETFWKATSKAKAKIRGFAMITELADALESKIIIIS